MTPATLTSKGQITIPKAVREALRLEPGDRVYFDVHDDGSVTLVARNEPLESLFGMLGGRAPRRRPLTVAEMSPASLDDE